MIMTLAVATMMLTATPKVAVNCEGKFIADPFARALTERLKRGTAVMPVDEDKAEYLIMSDYTPPAEFKPRELDLLANDRKASATIIVGDASTRVVLKSFRVYTDPPNGLVSKVAKTALALNGVMPSNFDRSESIKIAVVESAALQLEHMFETADEWKNAGRGPLIAFALYKNNITTQNGLQTAKLTEFAKSMTGEAIDLMRDNLKNVRVANRSRISAIYEGNRQIDWSRVRVDYVVFLDCAAVLRGEYATIDLNINIFSVALGKRAYSTTFEAKHSWDGMDVFYFMISSKRSRHEGDRR